MKSNDNDDISDVDDNGNMMIIMTSCFVCLLDFVLFAFIGLFPYLSSYCLIS